MAILNAREQEWILFLADKFEAGVQFVGINDFPGVRSLDQNQLHATIDRLEHFRFVEWHSQVSLAINPGVVEAAHQIRNPPPRDRPKEFETWVRDQWWSVPLLVLGIGIPAAWQWVEIVISLFRFAGAIGGP